MTEQEDKYSLFLKKFDELEIDTVYGRRVAWKPLHDYFMQLIREAGVELCDIKDPFFSTKPSLLSRWGDIKDYIKYIDDPSSWDRTLNAMHEIRIKVEHNDYYDPSKESLLKIREKAPLFKDWILKMLFTYYTQSKNYTFIDTFCKQSERYISHADTILAEFGEETPYVVRDDLHLLEDTYLYIPILKKRLEDKIQSSDLEKIEVFDLENLIKLVEIISRFQGKTEMLTRESICPKCGAKINSTQDYYGGNEDDLTPDGVYIRVGCEECDYTIHTNSISL